MTTEQAAIDMLAEGRSLKEAGDLEGAVRCFEEVLA